MTLAETGGFDVALEVTEELLGAAIASSVNVALPPDRDVTGPDMTLHVHMAAITPTGTDVLVGEVVLVRGTFSGTATVKQASIGGAPIHLPPDLDDVTLQGTFAISMNAGIGAVGGVRGVVLTPNPAASTAAVDEEPILASPPVQLVLASAYVSGGEAGYNQRKQQILAMVDGLATDALGQAVSNLTAAVALAEPAGLTFAAVRTSALTLKVLGTIAPPPGTPALATAMSVRRDAIGGPLDHVGLVVDNAALLGDIVRPAVAGRLGVSAATPPWFPGQPCLLLASLPVTLAGVTIPTLPGGAPGATVSVDFVHGFVNGSGLLQIDLTLRAVSWGAFATVTTSATLTAPFTAAVAGGTLTVGLGTPSVTTKSDVTVSPWLFVATAVLGAGVAVTILSAINLIAGPAIDSALRAPIAGAVGGALPSFALPLTGRFSALTVTQLVSFETAAPTRTVTLAGITIPLDRAHDVTVRLA